MGILILKSAACLAILMVFYKLFLENLAIHKFKRFYLLGALVVSIVIPFITFIEYIEPIHNFGTFNPNLGNTPSYFPADVLIDQPEQTNYLPIVLWSIYGLGVLLFGTKFCINLFGIVSKINKNEKLKHNNFISVLLNDLIVPHTFFSYIFLNKTKFEAKAIPREVLLHEQTHASQKHSLDILFIELLQIVFWFNPLLNFIKKDIKLNHEFLADEAVLKQGIDSSTYQETLLQFTSTANEIPLAHAINYSLIKKRFTIMKTQTSTKAIWLRSLLLLPLLGGLLFSFSGREQVEKEVVPVMEVTIPSTVEEYDNSIKIYAQKAYDYYQDKNEDNLNAVLVTHKNMVDFYTKLDYNNKLVVNSPVKLSPFLVKKSIEREETKKAISKTLISTKLQETTLTVNGIICNGCELNLSKKGVEKIILATTTGDNISSFKMKFPGYPTESIKGAALNANALRHLSKSNLGVVVSLFDIKTDKKEKLSPVLITIVNKNDKNYSHSPVVKKGEQSKLPPPPPPPAKKEIINDVSGFSKYILQMENNGDVIFYNNKKTTAKEAIAIYKKYGKIDILTRMIEKGKYQIYLSESKGTDSTIESEDLSNNPPPPPPPTKAPQYVKGKKLTLNEIIEKTPKGIASGFEMLKNGESHYYTVYQGRKTYYNKDGYITDKNGEILPPPPPPPVAPPNVIKGEASNIPEPPMPPEPISTEKHIRYMATKDASFFFNGDEISSEKAIELISTDKKMNISTQTNNGKSTVHLSTKPITVVNGQASFSEDKKRMYKAREKAMESRNEKRKEMLNKRKEMMEDSRNKMRTNESKIEEINSRKQMMEERKNMMQAHRLENQRPLSEQFKGMEKNGGEFFYEGDKISETKAIELIKENPKLNVSMSNLNGKSTVHLSKKGIKTVNGKIVKE